MLNYTNTLKEKRIELGLTIRALEEYTGVSKSIISKIERGETDMYVSTLVILAKFFKCNLSELIKY